MQTPKSLSLSLSLIKHNLCCYFSSLAETRQNSPLLSDYLIKTLNFSKKQAVTVSARFSHLKTLNKPQTLVHYLQNLGFSNTQIKSSVLICPQLLCSDVDKNLKPKIKFFQDLGLSGFDLGKFISMNSTVLTHSLDKRIVPHVEIIRGILVSGRKNKDLNLVVYKGSRLFGCPKERLCRNIAFLKNCGIFGSQLSMLLKTHARIFVMREHELNKLVSRVQGLGLSMESRMFVHGLLTLSGMSDEKFARKLELFQSFGFSENELDAMFTKAPGVMRVSLEKLRLGLEFFLNVVELDKFVICRTPTCLMHDIEDRAIPRYNVLQVLKSKRLLKKQPSFISALKMTEEEFLQKFVVRFIFDAEDLLVAYKGHLLGKEEK